MIDNLPTNYVELFSKKEIKNAISEIAPKVKAWVVEQRQITGKDPVALCVLRGAVYFYSDLTRAVKESISLEFLRYSTYDEKTNLQLPDEKLPALKVSLDIVGRAVLIIDDICESGRLLDILKNECSKMGATCVKTAVLVYRDIPRSTTLPDFFCFLIKHEEWLVGYGLDDQDRFRNLPAVYKIARPNV